MKSALYLGVLLLIYSCASQQTEEQPTDISFTYPKTNKIDSVDEYFGHKVVDSYRWLEDDRSAETEAWVKTQNKLTQGYLSQIPFRNKIKDRLTQLWNFEKYSSPFKKENYYFYYKNDGIQNQSVLYYQNGIDGEPRILIDPNKLSANGTASLSGLAITKNSKYTAYMISQAGSDWKEIHVMETASRKKLDDVVKWVKFSGISWFKDGFFYGRYDAPKEGEEFKQSNTFHKIFYHKLGTAQTEDQLVYHDPENAKRSHSARVTEDEKYLILHASTTTSGGMLMIKDLTVGNAEVVTIVDNFDNSYNVIRHKDGKLLVKTNNNAPKYKLIEIDLANHSSENWKEIIPESENVLQSVKIHKDVLIAKYLENVQSSLKLFDLAGNAKGAIELPGIGMVSGFNTDDSDSIAFYGFVNFTMPKTIYTYSFSTGKSEVYRKPSIDFKSEDYITKQLFYKSKDGTEIPMFVTHKKGIKLDGNNPVFLFGYGGFNISYSPDFRLDRTIFLENNGIYAVANIRGGGEFGQKWHKAGTKLNKQNVFDDFIAAAEFLIKEKYTNKEKLAIHGRSNGGLLAGALLTQRPDLFKVALPKVGVLDMLRYHKFTIGWAWAGDYGRSDDNEEMFKYLHAYSPIHNVKEVNYPATMIITGDHDDRVVPAHSFKFAANLQAKQKGKAPILIRIDSDAGHGSGKPVAKQIAEFSDTWAFVFYHLGMEM